MKPQDIVRLDKAFKIETRRSQSISKGKNRTQSNVEFKNVANLYIKMENSELDYDKI